MDDPTERKRRRVAALMQVIETIQRWQNAFCVAAEWSSPGECLELSSDEDTNPTTYVLHTYVRSTTTTTYYYVRTIITSTTSTYVLKYRCVLLLLIQRDPLRTTITTTMYYYC